MKQSPKHTVEELRQLQHLPLDAKIAMSRERIREWIREFGESGVYVSFSGGKESTYGATGIATPVQIGKMKRSDGTISDSQADRIYSVFGKSVTIKSNAGGGGAKTGLYKIDLPDGDYIIRKLTVPECMRLQTVPDWYDFSVISQTRAYKCLGNGWTIEVIMHLISQAMQSPCFRQLELF